jgi:DNA-binding NarL/FixJ family response regulator
MPDDDAAARHLSIAIVSNQCLVLHGLQRVLEDTETFRVDVHPYQRITQELFADRPPDLFILDLESEQDAVRTIQQIRESAPACKIVVLSGIDDKGRLLAAFACGIDGVILKIQPPEVILAVIEAIYAPVSFPVHVKRDRMEEGGLGGSFPKQMECASELRTWPEALTERERAIIRLVEQGLSNKDIADRLSISDSTVRHHMTNIFDKVGVPNRQKLLVHARHVRN